MGLKYGKPRCSKGIDVHQSNNSGHGGKNSELAVKTLPQPVSRYSSMSSNKGKHKNAAEGPNENFLPKFKVADAKKQKNKQVSSKRKSSILPERRNSAADKVENSDIIDRSNFVLEHSTHLELTQVYDVEHKKLGQGTYGSVSKGRKKDTGQIRAIKTIGKTQVRNVQRFRQEISIMKYMDHPNIVKLFETFEDMHNIYLVMELCQGGELFDRIIEEGYFTEKDAAILMKQIFAAINYLHMNSIMHRDLKPENFLLLNKSHDSPLKIIDFGLSCRFKNNEFSTTKAGTPYYVAPQVLQGCYDYRCDYWSSGVIMYILLCGYPPFYGETDNDVLNKVKSGVFSFSGPEWRKVSDDAKELIRKLLKMDANERYTAEQALRHPWIKNLVKMNKNVALPNTLVTNLKNFHAQLKLKKVALTVIAQHETELDIDNLRNIFTQLDTDASGSLSVQEITNGLRKLGLTEISPDMQEILKQIDSDGSGSIDYTEFIAATMDRRVWLREDVLWSAFRVFDMDGNGKISQDELRKVLGMPNVRSACGNEVIQSFLEDVDLDGDGEIDFDEFMHMMRSKDKPLLRHKNKKLMNGFENREESSDKNLFTESQNIKQLTIADGKMFL